MLRSVKSTQRKIRQLEVIIKKTSASGVSPATFSVHGPAALQVKSVADASNNGQVKIVLKQGFAQVPVMIANTSSAGSFIRSDDLNMTRKGSDAAGDELVLQHSDKDGSQAVGDDQVIHVLIVGSDITEKY